MKKIIFTLSFSMLTGILFGQNYFQTYPISATVGTNGTQFRLECSVYDSALQSIQTYNTPWYNDTVGIVGNDYGMITFNSWNTFENYGDSTFGFIIYDYTISQFKPLFRTFSPTVQYSVYMHIEPTGVDNWIRDGWDYYHRHQRFFYRYDMIIHEWVWVKYFDDENEDFDVAGFTMTGVIWVVKENDEGFFWIFDPATHQFHGNGTNCMGFYYTVVDDYIVGDGGCGTEIESITYNPEMHGWVGFVGYDACMECHENNGIFINSITDLSTGFKTSYLFTFDQALNNWAIDTIPGGAWPTIKDRVVVHSGGPGKMKLKTYSPTQHIWIADSVNVNGVSSLSINNGTVSWTDSTGAHIRGYIDGTGWGNYPTQLLLNFYITDLSASTGSMLVHVRNYSIGTDSVIFDFGDGTVSVDNARSLWHLYKNPGTYNICMTDVSGLSSTCQQVTFIQCAVGGIATVTDDSLCYGDTITLSVSGYLGSVQWQSTSINSYNWTNETGPGANTDAYTLQPLVNRKYRAMVTDSTCMPAYSNEIRIYISSPAIAGTAVAIPDTICLGTTGKLTSLNTSSTFRQWQRFDGTNWINETGPGSNSLNYYVSPDSTTTYRVFVNSGVCPSDTSNPVVMNVATFSDPVTVNDTICSSGVVNLAANGPGVIEWFEDTDATINIHTGSAYSPVINSTTDFYVRAKSNQATDVGPQDTLIGNTAILQLKYRGLRLTASTNAILDMVHIFPASDTTEITIKLTAPSSNQMIDSITRTVYGTNKTPVYLGFKLVEGLTYDLKIYNYAALVYNTSGASYPYAIPGSSVSITGYVDPSFHTDSIYYHFYDWQITEGCHSNLVPVTGVVGQLPNASITANSPLAFCQGDSVQLISNTIPGASYQWYRNGVALAGDTLSVYTVYLPGNYSVAIFEDTCSSVSGMKRVTIPCIYELEPEEKVTTSEPWFSSYFDHSSKLIHVSAAGLKNNRCNIEVFDNTGRIIQRKNESLTSSVYNETIDASSFNPGVYTLRLQSGNLHWTKKIAVIF
jgi:hypothetical protein